MSIILKGITKYFGKQKILNNLSLEIKKGEFHVLLGPSGEGKTTLLSIIAGLLKPDKGEVWIDKYLVNNLPPQKRNIGFVFQDHALFPHLTVYENVAYGLRAKGIKEKIIKEKVLNYIKLVNLIDYQNKYPSELSGGQKQKVALARALVIEPYILLLDEPLSNIDAWQKEHLREELKNIQKKTGVTTLYVTHDQSEAFVLADRISILHKGSIEQVETPEDIFYHPKTPFVATFVGATNILKGKIIKYNEFTVQFLVLQEGLTKPLIIFVKKYPLFRQKNEIFLLCLHPEKISLKEKPQLENRFLSRILNIIPHGIVLKIMVDVYGLKLQVVIPKINFNFDSFKDNIWVCFSPDALHPLCGKCYRDPEYRKCNYKTNIVK